MGLWMSKGKNTYYNISRHTVLADIENYDLGPNQAGYQHSNFNFAVLGLVIEAVCGDSFIHLMNSYLEGLGLQQTAISTAYYDLDHYERFSPEDAYLAAGQVSSNVEDMMAYLNLQLQRDHPILARHISDLPEAQTIGYAWHFHDQGFLWHNGASNHFNAFMAFHPPSQKGLVVLVNLPVNEGASATQIGQGILLSWLANE